MLSELEKLKAEEKELILDAVPLVTVLIAGADGKFSAKEREWATKLTNIRSFNSPDNLSDYYSEIGKQFDRRVDELIKAMPDTVEDRNQAISEQLAKLNNILPRLDNNTAYNFYKSLKSFAEHVARADGGILRFASINKEEMKWIKLPMIHPVILEEEESDE